MLGKAKVYPAYTTMAWMSRPENLVATSSEGVMAARQRNKAYVVIEMIQRNSQKMKN